MKKIIFTLMALSLPFTAAQASDFGPMFSDTSIVSLGANEVSLDGDMEAMLSALEPAGGDEDIIDTSASKRVYAQPLDGSPVTIQIRPENGLSDN